jgi:hypothetical protein
MTVLNLFRGQCIGVKVDATADDCIVTLDLEDYNRLPPILPLGAPVGDNYLTQDDGTYIAIDPRGQYTGLSQMFADFTSGGCWPDASPVLDLVTGFLSDEIPATPLVDNSTALTSLKAHADQLIPRISGSARWWIAPPPSGDGLVLYVVDFANEYQTALLPAPYAIDNDAPDWITSVMPSKLGPISWDWAHIRGSVYVRGGTPTPDGSGFATGNGNSETGTAYIDAPGSITDDDRAEIGAWRQNHDFVELLTGSAKLLPGWMEPYSGDLVNSPVFRVGETILVTSERHSRLASHALTAYPTVIQKISGRLVTGRTAGLAIKIGGTAITKPYSWKSLTFESVLSGTGKASVAIHLLGSTDTLTVAGGTDVWITLDDAAPADIEWDIQFGDIPAGGLTKELAKVADKPPPPVVYRFKVEVRDPEGVMAGVDSEVSAQLCDGAERPVALAGVPLVWVNPPIQWEDTAQTVVGDLLILDDDTGTTDTAGRVFTTLHPSDPLPAHYNWEVSAVALPIP